MQVVLYQSKQVESINLNLTLVRATFRKESNHHTKEKTDEATRKNSHKGTLLYIPS